MSSLAMSPRPPPPPRPPLSTRRLAESPPANEPLSSSSSSDTALAAVNPWVMMAAANPPSPALALPGCLQLQLSGCSSNASSAAAGAAVDSIACQRYSYASVCPYDVGQGDPLRPRYFSADGRVVLLLADPWRGVWALTAAAFGDSACMTNKFLALASTAADGAAPDLGAPTLSAGADAGGSAALPAEPDAAGDAAAGGVGGGITGWFGFSPSTEKFDVKSELTASCLRSIDDDSSW